jgi:hypothetical protein
MKTLGKSRLVSIWIKIIEQYCRLMPLQWWVFCSFLPFPHLCRGFLKFLWILLLLPLHGLTFTVHSDQYFLIRTVCGGDYRCGVDWNPKGFKEAQHKQNRQHCVISWQIPNPIGVCLSGSGSNILLQSVEPTKAEGCAMNPEHFNVSHWECSMFGADSLTELCANNP